MGQNSVTDEMRKILITGQPGSGKTTLIRRLSEELRDLSTSGFYTEEIRTNGVRQGFRLSTFDGKITGVLAHVELKGPHQVGRYGVDVEGFERFLDTLKLLDSSPRLVMIDEIGKIECISARFRSLVLALFASPVPLIATIALKGDGFMDELKRGHAVRLHELDGKNRDRLLYEIVSSVLLQLPG